MKGQTAMPTRATELLGVGLYSVPEVAQLIRVSTSNVRRWVDGYEYRHRGTTRTTPPLICPELRAKEGAAELLTFLDLMELKFVSMFRSPPHRISMPVIRAAWLRASNYFASDHPFCMKQFRTDGKRIFAELQETTDRPSGMSRADFVEELAIAQLVFADMVEPFFLELEWDHDLANRYWPLGKKNRVVLDPQRSFGKPIDSPTGVRTFTLYQASLSGETRKRIAEWYDVPVIAVTKAVQYERYLQGVQ